MALPKIIDSALDALVVPGFSRIGYLVRASQYSPLDHNALRGKTVAITGPTSGLGKAAAKQLAAMGSNLILIGRSFDKLQQLLNELVRDSDDQMFSTVIADMGDLDSVALATRQILDSYESLHAVIHNAGALLKERSTTAQGFETTIATHVLGPHQMTMGLLPLLRTSRGRVITVSSGGMYAASLPNVLVDESPEMTSAYYDGTKQYAIAKRIQVTLNEMWAKQESEISFASMHPGWADTPGVQDSLPAFRLITKPLLRSASQGADTMCWLCSDDVMVRHSGKFWSDRAERLIHRLPRTRNSDTHEAREAIWQWCDQRISK
jgi:NAD(P)-dependent dehydrogenase (short-subunit alcohol dehydrogenase family)